MRWLMKDLTQLSKEEFGLKDNPRISIYHEDARTFLNREARYGEKKYNAIFVDVFSSFSIPFHLTTHEAIGKMEQLLNENGLIVVNIISAIDGDKGQFFQAELATYKSIFPYVTFYPVNSKHSYDNQNLILVASNNRFSKVTDNKWNFNREWSLPVAKKAVLTDDFAPVDQYVRTNEM